MTDNKCGTCIFGKIFKQDLMQRRCEGLPPQVVLMPAQGGMQMQFHFPLVTVGQEACALYKARTVLDTPEGNA